MKFIILLYFMTLVIMTYSKNVSRAIELQNNSEFGLNISDLAFIVTIQKKDNISGYSHYCGGSIINQYFILTSAQCFANSVGMELIDLYCVRAGIMDKTHVYNHQLVNISNLYLHPGYSRYATEVYDISLIRLKEKLLYSENVRPVVLARVDDFNKLEPEEYFRDGDCIVAGLKCSNEANSRQFLTISLVSIIKKNKCTKHLSIKSNQLCSVKQYKSDYCFGSPLICKGYQVGILSWSCDMHIWTRVDQSYEWIKKIKNYHSTVDAMKYAKKSKKKHVGLYNYKFINEYIKNYTNDKIKNEENIIKNIPLIMKHQIPILPHDISLIHDQIESNPTARKINDITRIDISDFPYLVSIHKKDQQKLYKPTCSGSIISQCLILTSAQCFITHDRIEPLHKYQVYSGISDVNNLDDVQPLHILNIHIHPNYNHQNKTNDISLAVLLDRLIFNQNIQPIVLTDYNINKKYFLQTNCIVYKWECSQKYENMLSSYIKRIPIYIIENSVCNINLFVKNKIDNSHLCTIISTVDKQGFCWHDIGSPLICEGVQVGVLSWSMAVDIWTRVDQNYDWIRTVNNSYNKGIKYKDTFKFKIIAPLFNLRNVKNISNLMKIVATEIYKIYPINKNKEHFKDDPLELSSKTNYIYIVYVLLILNIFLII